MGISKDVTKLTKVDRKFFNIVEAAPLEGDNFCYTVTHYKGFLSEMNKMLAFFAEAGIRYEEVCTDSENGIMEVKAWI